MSGFDQNILRELEGNIETSRMVAGDNYAEGAESWKAFKDWIENDMMTKFPDPELREFLDIKFDRIKQSEDPATLNLALDDLKKEIGDKYIFHDRIETFKKFAETGRVRDAFDLAFGDYLSYLKVDRDIELTKLAQENLLKARESWEHGAEYVLEELKKAFADQFSSVVKGGTGSDLVRDAASPRPISHTIYAQSLPSSTQLSISLYGNHGTVKMVFFGEQFPKGEVTHIVPVYASTHSAYGINSDQTLGEGLMQLKEAGIFPYDAKLIFAGTLLPSDSKIKDILVERGLLGMESKVIATPVNQELIDEYRLRNDASPKKASISTEVSHAATKAGPGRA